MWIETKDNRIIEVDRITETDVIGREVLYMLETPKLKYGELTIVDKGDVIWN